MIRALGSLLFYGRFLRSFSALGYRRRAEAWEPFEPDFSGQTWMVTGATGGIGRTVALTANAAGARVLALARSEEKLSALRDDAQAPDRMVPIRIDLSRLAEISGITERDELTGLDVDVLVNSVGVLLNDFQTTEEGFERSFATNLLGHWVLTETLQADRRLSDDGIVIEVSSGGMYGTPLKLDPMNCDDAKAYDGMTAYAMHKRAQVELTHYWNAQWEGAPAVHVMHPGWVDTEGVKTALPGFRTTLQGILRNADQGADTILWLGAERPEPVEEGIWLDRELQPEHEFGFTRKSPNNADELAEFLAELAQRALD